MSTVLIVDDERVLREALDVNLRARGFGVELAPSGRRALTLTTRRQPDVIVLDLGLPDMDGVDVIRRLRERTAMPIVVLSADTTEASKVAALDAGANDYVTKPFGMGELMARLRVAVRNGCDPVLTQPGTIVETPDFTIDLAAKRVRRDGRDVRLTPVEWRLVELLARNARRVVPQRHMLEIVWGLDDGQSNQTTRVRVLMISIRRKLEPDPARPRYFVTKAGRGITFVPDGLSPRAVVSHSSGARTPGGPPGRGSV